MLVQLGGGALLHDRPVAQHGDAVGERQRLLLVVRDEDGRDPLLADQALHLLADVRAHRGVKGGERLVEQQRQRAPRECSRQRHPLLLAAGELVREAAREVRDPDHLEHLPDDLAAAPLGPRQPEADVAGHVEVREQRAFLGHVADPALLRRHVATAVVQRPAGKADLAALGALEAGDDAEQRRLAAPGEAEHGGQRARGDLQVHAAQHRLAPVALPEPGDLQAAHARPLSGERTRRLSSSAGTAEIRTIRPAYGAAAP